MRFMIVARNAPYLALPGHDHGFWFLRRFVAGDGE
jgi:hypothetical protein